MNTEEYLNSIPADVFQAKCVELWHENGCPLLGDMASEVYETYNNEAIEKLVSNGLDTEQIDE